MDRRTVWRTYARSWFILDLPASLPYIFLSKYLPLRTPLGVFIAFDLLKCLRLPRAFRYLARQAPIAVWSPPSVLVPSLASTVLGPCTRWRL